MAGKAVIVAGMAYGDEAKGATVDYLCRELGAGLIVRYNGGHQAAHNVVTPKGLHHTFSQFGSGSFVPGVKTHLSHYVVINPIAMIEEAEHLKLLGIDDIWERTTVHQSCIITTPYHRAFNRLQEISRGHRAHGSCGMGIGDTKRLALAGLSLQAHHLLDGHPYKIHLRVKLMDIKHRLAEELQEFRYLLEDTAEIESELAWFYGEDRNGLLCAYYAEWIDKIKLVPHAYLTDTPVIFEGAQGVLLDEKHGHPDHNTWSNTTFENAQTLLDEAGFTGERVKLGCWRSYFTRHGNGPLATEMPWDRWKDHYPEPHNTYGRYQGSWRIGDFDMVAAIDAIRICNGVDQAAISHMDVHGLDLDYFKTVTNVSPTLISNGPTANDRRKL